MAPWRRVLGSAVGAVDRAVVVAMQMRGARDRARADKMGHDERIEVLAAVHRDYGGDEIVAEASGFFPTASDGNPGRCFSMAGPWRLPTGAGVSAWCSRIPRRP